MTPLGFGSVLDKKTVLSLTLPQMKSILRLMAKQNKKVKQQVHPGIVHTGKSAMKALQEEYRKQYGNR